MFSCLNHAGRVDAYTSVLTSVNSPATLCSRVERGQA